jgi:hypothetical protein
VVEDVRFTNNIIRNSEKGINILGRDNNHPSEQVSNILIDNNLFVTRDSQGPTGEFMQVTQADRVTVMHNTIVMDFALRLYGVASINFVMRDNLFAGGGMHGDRTSEGVNMFATFLPGADVRRNVFGGMEPRAYRYSEQMVATNYFTPQMIGDAEYVNASTGNYRLAATSQFNGQATDGTDVGADIDYLEGVTGGQIQTPPPVWAPIITFSASSRYVAPSTSLTLSWVTMDATIVTIDQGIGSVPVSGSLTVTPTQTTTYLLTAQGTGGTVTRRVTVNALPSGNTYQASRDFSGTQGLRNWSYLYGSGNPMTFDPYISKWRGTQQYMRLWENGGHPGSNMDVTRRWTAPASGSVRITGSASDANGSCGDGVVVSISKGGTVLWQQTVANGDAVGFSYDLANTVIAAHTLNFTINRISTDSCDATNFDPTIVFTPAVNLAPVADAYVKGADAFMDTNFGVIADLQVKRTLNTGSGNGRQSYLRFDTSSITGTISRATLRVYGNLNAMVGANQNIPCAVFPVSDTPRAAPAVAPWTELGITWNNKPGPDVPNELTRVTVADDVPRWYEFDITSFINSERAAGRTATGVILRNMTNGEAGDYYTVFNSREAAANRPQLVIQQ